jgi:hypothetical protein
MRILRDDDFVESDDFKIIMFSGQLGMALDRGCGATVLAAAVEAGDEPVALVASIRQHFAGTGLELELPDRKSALQRPITFGS